MVLSPTRAHRSHATAITTTTFFFFFLLPSFLSAQQPPLPTETITFDSFNNSNTASFTFSDNASYAQGALQLTPDSLNIAKEFLQNKSGRAVFGQRFKLWEFRKNSSTIVASFNTTFDFNIYWIPNTSGVGEGLAFGIFPNTDGPPPGSTGRFLGLTNSTTDGSSTNKLVAIELDTVKQKDDPDGNHVGLDINSVVSNVTASLTNNTSGYNIVLSPHTDEGAIYTVWVDYSGPMRQIKVYMANQTQPKPASPVLTAGLDLSKYVSQYSYFGFAGSTGEYYELNCIKKWIVTVEILPEEPGRDVLGWLLKLGLPLVLLATLALVVVVVIYVHKYKKKGRHDARLRFALKSLPGMPKEYDYKELKVATGNFDDRNRLGKGGFGVVYRGKLPGEETEIAVKSFSRESSQGDDFLAELTIINRLRHRNLVPLLGWCYRNGKLLLVYEYMPNGSLDKHLFIDAGETPLPWERRYNVVSGMASALQYLHTEYDQKVVHRDLKASNIMLDSAFNARLGDFGLARTIDNERTSYAELGQGMPGTWGYIAPECLHTGKATRDSDVFGFGAVVLEVVCGRRPGAEVGGFRLLADWVWMLYREGRILEAVDEKLQSDYVAEEAELLLLLGLACCHPIAGERPKTPAILQIIGKSVPVPTVPPFKPAFVWPGFSMESGEETTTSTMGSNYIGTPLKSGTLR